MTDDSDFRERHLRNSDFLGAFGVIENAEGILMVQNRRRIRGASTLTWDLPGGQVEPGEGLLEALARELHEELGVRVRGGPRFLFYQEGAKLHGGRRGYMWRSFFFAVEDYDGVPRRGDVLAVRRVPRAEMRRLLRAPYHDSFLEWLERGGSSFSCTWRE